MAADSEKLKELRIDRSGAGARLPARVGVWSAVALVVAAAAVAAYWFAAHRAVAVTVASARAATGGSAAAGAVLNASGYVTARREATVSAKVTGKVVEVLVEEGMQVEAGQVLARLDDSIARKNLALFEAQLAVARSSKVTNQVNLDLARRTLSRTQELFATQFASQADLDAAQAAAASLEAQIRTDADNVTVAERGVALQRQGLEDTVIRAPFAGVAVSKDAQPGEMISPVSAGGGFTRTGISTIVDMSSLEIEVDVNEGYIQRVKGGQKVEATLDSYPDWRIPCHVITIIPTANREKATVKVRIGFDQLDPRILPDMGVKVSFLEDVRPGSAPVAARVTVPKAAIRNDGGSSVVLVVADGRVERRAVRTGLESEGTIEVLSGLNAGEKIVIDGPANLKDGDRVR
jgi:RND family efflux transporter MFP subunit